MTDPNYKRLLELASAGDALERSACYAAQWMKKFVRKNEIVFQCFPTREENSLGAVLEHALLKLDAIPVYWGPDYRWRSLLRQLFLSRATVLIGPPLVVLGIAKLARHTGTPLHIRSVMTAGYPCPDWMIEGIMRLLDCTTWGCFGPGTGALITGFSCGQSRGVHIRDEEYCIEIEDGCGNPLPGGQQGNIILSSRARPDIRCATGEVGRILTDRCACGCQSPRLLDLGLGSNIDPTMATLGAQLHNWSSILDCRMAAGPCGLELELVVFPGEKLPKLPSCAKLNIRPWDPERDIPMSPMESRKNQLIYHDYY